MEKVDITIIQKPVDVVFICPQCKNDIELTVKKFEEITNADLTALIYDEITFNCPECNCGLKINEVELD